MRPTAGILLTAFLGSIGCSQHGSAETTIFAGRNVYSPALSYDEKSKTYEMWYGGWQRNADFPKDRIYYRKSKDRLSWSSPVTVLQPSQISADATHVNDPSVVTYYDAAAHSKKYVMFYTVCLSPCRSYSANQIWSSISSDGRHWTAHKPLITANGAAEPSAVANSTSPSARWAVYYSNTNETNAQPRNVYVATVDENRNATSKDRLVFSYKLDSGVIANPEIALIGGEWHLFFNVYHRRSGARRDTADVYFAKSRSKWLWPGAKVRPVILYDPKGTVCGAGAPGVLPLNGSGQFVLFFGEARFSTQGTCDLSNFRSMKAVERRPL